MIYSKLKTIFWVLLTMLFIVFTPTVFNHAKIQRGYDAIGGEIFFPIMPLVLWVLVKVIKDMLKEMFKK